jgi:hypothetical protein
MDHDSKDPAALLGWSDKQGAILTGGGELAKRSTPGVDFVESDLPHYLLAAKRTRKQFSQWLQENRRSFEIVGCWSRPIFAGGWNESSLNDTEAFNLQTPSMFIDMRIPLQRPTAHLKMRGTLSNCTDEELRILARQHCFAGYSLPIPDPQGGPVHFVRHHVIDWNYHPSFPRNRPNRWWITTDVDERRALFGEAAFPSTFKEFSFARDKYGIPVYFERWARRPADSGGTKYLALRRKVGCPIAAKERGVVVKRDAILIVVGNHFAICIDRPQPQQMLPGAPGPGGPAYLDYAVMTKNRDAAMKFLELEGSYGHVWTNASAEKLQSDVFKPNWYIKRSTQPWKEGQRLFREDDAAVLHWKSATQTFFGPNILPVLETITLGDDVWEVLECSFTDAEISVMFSVRQSPASKL